MEHQCSNWPKLTRIVKYLKSHTNAKINANFKLVKLVPTGGNAAN